MAGLMMEKIKNDILSQPQQSIIAQASKRPEFVLQMLHIPCICVYRLYRKEIQKTHLLSKPCHTGGKEAGTDLAGTYEEHGFGRDYKRIASPYFLYMRLSIVR